MVRRGARAGRSAQDCSRGLRRGVALRRSVPAALDAGGRLTIPRAQIVRMEAEARLSIDGDGTIVLVGQNPSEARRGALLFGIVALVGLLNMAAVAVFVRRRRRMAAGETA